MKNIIETLNKIDDLYTQTDIGRMEHMKEYLSSSLERSYILKKISENFDNEWFKFAHSTGLLSFDTIPPAIETEETDGSYSYGFKTWEGVFPILEAAKNMSKNVQIVDLLLDIVDSYIKLAEEQKIDKKRNFTVDYYICRVILLFPIDKIKKPYLTFIFEFGLTRDSGTLSRELTGSFFNRVLKYNNILAIDLLDLFFTPIIDKRLYKFSSKIDNYALENFTKSEPINLYDKLGDDVVNWAVNKLINISEMNQILFTKFSLPSLEPDEQNTSESDFNFSIVRLVTNLLSSLPVNKLNERLELLISNSHQPIMRRISYYELDKNYNELYQLFWGKSNPLNDWDAKLEIFRLIKRNCGKFEIEEVSKIVKWIDELEVEKLETENEIEYARRKAYLKLEWYLALEPIHNKYAEQIITHFDNLNKITKGNLPSHPGYDSYFSNTTGRNYHQNNLSLDKTPYEVLNTLKQNMEYDYTYELQQDLNDYIVSSYSRISESLDEFVNLPISFVYSFMNALRIIAEKSGTLNIVQTFNFINKFITDRIDIWDFSSDEREKSSSIGMIAWLLNTVIRNNASQLSLDEIKLAINALIKMERSYSVEFSLKNGDPINDIINSTRGKIYDALIYTSIQKRKNESIYPAWDEDVQNLFTYRLDKGTSEFYWSVGFNVPQISYLNMEWLTYNKDILLNYKEEKFDKPVFYGYLLFSTQLYTDIFKFFLTTYFDQLRILIDNSSITRRFVEHIWIAFVIEIERTEELISELIGLGNKEQLGFLIDRIKIEDSTVNIDKIRYVWKKILSIAQSSANKDLRNKTFEMVYFAEFFNDLDDNDFNMFEHTLKLGGSNINSYRLLRFVEDKFKNKNFTLAGRLLESIIRNTTQETFFDEDKLMEIVEILYQNNQNDNADKISIAAVERHNFRLMTIYNKYH